MKKVIILLALLLIPSVAIADSLWINGIEQGAIESDPIAGAITGIIKADGGGNISPAVAGSDFLAPNGAASEITIAAGVANITSGGYYTIDTQGDGATDDLDQITSLSEGDEVIIRPENDARTVVVKNGANMILCNGANFTMENINDRMVIQAIGGDICVEVSRSNGGG